MINFSMNSGKLGPFRLKRIKYNVYQIHAGHGPAFEGSKKIVFERAVQLGVHAVDITIADFEMKKLGHDIAEFGLGGRFLFTGVDKKRVA